MRLDYFFAGILFWGVGIFAIWICYKKNTPIIQIIHRDKLLITGIIIVVVLCCTIPMCLSPYWNGEFPESRNQYEIMAESLLDGHIDLDYGDTDSKLLEMENPYDPEMREALGVSYHFDHAFYNGHYYMYFGIVPVILLFLPFRIITGVSLTTYHASQIFTALFIIGLFLLFALWAKKWFPKLSIGIYIALSTAFSIMSVWYIVATPALYCTAICSALCMEVWSLFFFSKAVWDNTSDHQSLIFGVLGSVFGALSFGCRPPIALANLLAVPMLIQYIKKRKWDGKLIRQIIAFFLPYVIIGVLLMVYNYVRFDNPFEFGQTYQLTISDQSNYGNFFSRFNLIQLIDGILKNFIGYNSLMHAFPYVTYCSVFMNFPICVAAYCCLFHQNVNNALKTRNLQMFAAILFGLPYFITIIEIFMSPMIVERYRSDIYWLMGLLAFIAFGLFYQNIETNLQKRFSLFLILFAYITIFQSLLLWMFPGDCNYTAVFPESLNTFKKVMMFGFG